MAMFEDTGGNLRLRTLEKMQEAEEGFEVQKARITQIKTQMNASIPGMGAWTNLDFKLQEARQAQDLYRDEVIMYATMLTAYASLVNNTK